MGYDGDDGREDDTERRIGGGTGHVEVVMIT